jgi:hypothetical protein
MENSMNQEKSEHQSKEQFRVVINREANEALEAFLGEVLNSGENSKVNKSDIANYVFCRLGKLLGATEIGEIRSLFFDAKKALEVILKGASSSDELPEDLREALLKHCGIKRQPKEKAAKKLSTVDLRPSEAS